jgi:predicted Zn-dependent protease
MKTILTTALLLLFPFIFLGQNTSLDQALGQENAKMVEAQVGLYDDAEKSAYLQELGDRLVDNLEEPLFEYQFHIVPHFMPNAFALPGGYVYLTTGMIPILETEDELACIIAHEIIHSNNRHSVQQLKKSILPRLLEVPGNLLGVLNKDLGALFNAPIQTSNALLFASYGRTFETEADNYGIQLAAKAGYDPDGMISSLERMSEAIEEATGMKEQKSYFNDHPYTPTRTKSINQTASKIDWEKKDPISENFLMTFDSVLFGNHPNQGVIRENQFLHPDLDFTIYFPQDWNIDNQPTNVGAYHPDRKAAVFVAIEEQGQTPLEAGYKFINSMDDKYRSKMTNNEPYELNGNEGYLISFTEKDGPVQMYAYVLWIPVEGKLFKMIGITPLENKAQLEETAASLRVLNKGEKDSFTIDLLRVVEAKDGETISSLSSRVGNVLNSQLTATINNLDEEEKLKQGELIKVVLAYPYRPHQ